MGRKMNDYNPAFQHSIIPNYLLCGSSLSVQEEEE
jgi:hypothetical protein